MKWRCFYRHETPTGPEKGEFVVEAPRSVEATMAAIAELGERKLGDGVSYCKDVMLWILAEKEEVLVTSDDGKDDVSLRIWPLKGFGCPLMLAGLTPHESWAVLGFLFACVLMLLLIAFGCYLFWSADQEEQTLLTKLKEEKRLIDERLRSLLGPNFRRDQTEEVDPVTLYREASTWGGEQP